MTSDDGQSRFAIIPQSIIHAKNLTPAEFRVLSKVIQVCAISGKYWQNHTTTANQLQMTRQWIATCLARLVKKQYLCKSNDAYSLTAKCQLSSRESKLSLRECQLSLRPYKNTNKKNIRVTHSDARHDDGKTNPSEKPELPDLPPATKRQCKIPIADFTTTDIRWTATVLCLSDYFELARPKSKLHAKSTHLVSLLERLAWRFHHHSRKFNLIPRWSLELVLAAIGGFHLMVASEQDNFWHQKREQCYRLDWLVSTCRPNTFENFASAGAESPLLLPLLQFDHQGEFDWHKIDADRAAANLYKHPINEQRAIQFKEGIYKLSTQNGRNADAASGEVQQTIWQ